MVGSTVGWESLEEAKAEAGVGREREVEEGEEEEEEKRRVAWRRRLSRMVCP